MFSAILQGVAAIGGVVGGISSAQQNYAIAREQLDLQRQAQRQQYDFGMLQYGLGLDQLRREREQERYIREENARKQQYLEEEYGLRLDSQRARASQSMAERQYMLDRQVQVDRSAAQQRAFQIEQLLRNQDLAASEREYAVRMLEDARATAMGERDEDLMRYYSERDQALNERNFAIDEMRRAQTIASTERYDDLSLRNRILDQSTQLRDALFDTFTDLGDAPEAPRVTKAMLDDEIGRREDRAMGDVDRALDRVASVGEADLMRRGVERSSTATAKRAEIAERGADMYAKARDQARDEALRYMSGVQESLFKDYEGQLKQRSVAFQDVGNVYGAGMDVAKLLPQLRSANDYRSPVQVGSGVFTRQVRSANDFRAPINVGTSIYDREVGSGMGATLNLPSAAAMQELNPGSRLNANFSKFDVTNPSSFMSVAGSAINGAASNVGSPEPWLRLATQGASSAGSAFSNLTKLIQGWEQSGGGGGGDVIPSSYGTGGLYVPVSSPSTGFSSNYGLVPNVSAAGGFFNPYSGMYGRN